MEALEIAKAIPPFLTAGAAIYGVYLAKLGLDKWRRETIGKRKVELAEEVLASFYEARDIITWARFPGSVGSEGSTRPREPGESEDDARRKDSYYVTPERLNKKAEFFAQLQARKYRFAVMFGKDKAKPFDDVHEIKSKVIVSAHMLIRTHRQGGDPVETAQLSKNRRDWEDTVGWGVSEEDAIARRLDGVIENVEKSCRPIIDESTKSWTK